jgi:hypothetical protein
MTKRQVWLLVGLLVLYVFNGIVIGITKLTIFLFFLGLVGFIGWLVWEGRRVGLFTFLSKKKESSTGT